MATKCPVNHYDEGLAFFSAVCIFFTAQQGILLSFTLNGNINVRGTGVEANVQAPWTVIQAVSQQPRDCQACDAMY